MTEALPDYIPPHWHSRIRVVRDERGTHYLWTGWNNGEGHGKVRVAGKMVYCYRWLYEQITGTKLTRWDHIDHLCERKPCLNFDHWEKVLPGENTRRGPGRQAQFKPLAEYINDMRAQWTDPLDWTDEQLERFSK